VSNDSQSNGHKPPSSGTCSTRSRGNMHRQSLVDYGPGHRELLSTFSFLLQFQVSSRLNICFLARPVPGLQEAAVTLVDKCVLCSRCQCRFPFKLPFGDGLKIVGTTFVKAPVWDRCQEFTFKFQWSFEKLTYTMIPLGFDLQFPPEVQSRMNNCCSNGWTLPLFSRDYYPHEEQPQT
jgi:hypothetical protein